MPIELDWNFESDDLPEEPTPRWRPEPRPGRSRGWLIGLGLAALLTAGSIIAGRTRLRQVDQLKLQTLEDTIAAETLALRIGDRDAFMLAQARVERWPDAQAIAFGSYQELGVVASGEIISQEVDGDLAKVTLREYIDGEPYQAVWFYEYGSVGWRHTPSRSEYWGDIAAYESQYYRVSYAPVDRAYAVQVGQSLDAKVEAMCDLLVCRPGFYPQTVTIETDALAFAFVTSYKTGSQIAPSPQISRVPEGEPPAFDPAQATAIIVSDQSWFLARNGWNAGMQHFDDDLDQWLTHQLLPGEPSSALFSIFEEVYGPDFVPEMMRMVSLGNEARPAARYLLDGALIDEDSALEEELSVLLNFEHALRDQGYWPEANYLFGDPLQPYDSSAIDLESPVYIANDEPMSVESAQEVGDVVWAEVAYYQDVLELQAAMQRRTTLQGFRNVNGQWYRIEAQESDWGEERELRGRNITLYYRSFDEPYAEGVLNRLDAIYTTAAADFQLGDPDRLLQVEVTLSPVSADWGRVLARRQPDTLTHLALPSPALGYYAPSSAADPFKTPALNGFLGELLSDSLLFRNLGYIENALVDYEAARFGLWEVHAGPQILAEAGGSDIDLPLLPLDALRDVRPADRFDYAVLSITADNLIEVLTRDFGDDILPSLVKHLRDGGDTYDWLAAVFADMDAQGLWPYATHDYYGVIAQIEGEVLSLTGREITTILDVQTP